jgi:hypothetical protein
MKRALALFVGILALAPGAAFAQAQNSIFGCNQTSAYAMSVGSLTALGGNYVPVSDSATTLNTGYTVYKSCVLDPMVSAMAHAANYALSQAEIQQILTSRNGNPAFVSNYGQESFNAYDSAYNSAFPSVTSALTPGSQSVVATALARSYAQQTQSPYTSLTCPYSGTDFWATLSANVLYPSCSAYWDFEMAQNQLASNAAAAQYAWQTQLNWGNGFYPITDSYGNVVTPGILVGQVAGQAITSGQNELAAANAVGQMVPSLIAGISNQILSGAQGGLAGINTSIGGQPSYLARAQAQASSALGQAVTNVALVNLNSALSNAQQYSQIENSIANSLLQAVTQLRGTENTCWGLIQQNVCSSSATSTASGANTCTASNGSTLHIATSTYGFAQSVIDSQITPLANAYAQNIKSANQLVTVLNGLIVNVQNNNSSTVQQAALSTLDQINSQLPTSATIAQAGSEQTQVADLLTNSQTGLIPTTIALWAGNSSDGTAGAVPWNGSSSAGWCNASQSTPGGPATLQLWTTKWSSPTS